MRCCLAAQGKGGGIHAAQCPPHLYIYSHHIYHHTPYRELQVLLTHGSDDWSHIRYRSSAGHMSKAAQNKMNDRQHEVAIIHSTRREVVAIIRYYLVNTSTVASKELRLARGSE